MQNFGREFHWWGEVRRLRQGDVLLWIGYLRPQEEPIAAALARGAEAVTVWVDPGATTDQRTHIRGCWKDFDTVIDLEGYPIRVLPTSGVVGTGQWHALMAETIAARNGNRQ